VVATSANLPAAQESRQSATETRFMPFGSDSEIMLSVRLVRELICVPTRSGKRCSEQEALKFILLCKSRALNPYEGDAYLIGFDGEKGPSFSLITAHQAFLKRAEVSQDYDGMESGVIVRTADGQVLDREGDFVFDDDVLLGGWATVFMKNRSHPTKRRLKFSTFSKQTKIWRENPAGQIVKCAEADALRSTFPTKLGGMYLEEELAPKQVEAQVATPPGPGRVSLRGNGHAALEASEDLAREPETWPDDAPSDADVARSDGWTPETRVGLPDSQPGDDEEEGRTRADAMTDLEALLRLADSVSTLQGVGADMMKQREWLGEDNYARLEALYQERFKGLQPAAAGARGRK